MTTDTMRAAVGAMEGLMRYAARNICMHEETKRGGAIWEICCSCGAKWADDRGGKPPYEDPAELIAAEAALSLLRAALKEGGEPKPVAIWQSDTGDGRTWCDCSESNARAAEKNGFKARVLFTRPIAADTQGDAKDAALPVACNDMPEVLQAAYRHVWGIDPSYGARFNNFQMAQAFEAGAEWQRTAGVGAFDPDKHNETSYPHGVKASDACLHEETERLGAIWIRCTQCGLKWADDDPENPLRPRGVALPSEGRDG